MHGALDWWVYTVVSTGCRLHASGLVKVVATERYKSVQMSSLVATDISAPVIHILGALLPHDIRMWHQQILNVWVAGFGVLRTE